MLVLSPGYQLRAQPLRILGAWASLLDIIVSFFCRDLDNYTLSPSPLLRIQSAINR